MISNGYSIHIGFRTYHIRNSGVLQSRITLYKNGKTELERVNTHLFRNVKFSSTAPDITIDDTPVLRFDMNHYQATGTWIYYITLTIKDVQANLTFTGTTPGWKIETTTTNWTTPLPKATVAGTLTLKGKTMMIEGQGYHDHNWSYSAATAFSNIGWYWGKISGEKLQITWAKTIKTTDTYDLLGVVNRDIDVAMNGTPFVSINPKRISFIPGSYKSIHGQRIPTIFNMSFFNSPSDETPLIDANITMKTLDIQHLRITLIHYWRYHVLASGTITMGVITETLKDKPQIIEVLSFKSQKKQKL
jgi:hypothetical protein